MADISLGSVVGVPVVVPSITPAVAYTPVFTGLGTGTYTTSAYTWTVGSRRYVVATLTMTAAGSGGAVIAMSLPTNSVINSAALPTGGFGNYTKDTLGWMTAYNTASSGVNASDRLVSVYAVSSTTVGFVKPATSSAQTGSDWSLSAQVGIEFNYADSSLAGQDTVAYGAGLATNLKSGLVSNAIAPTNLISTDLTSQTNCTIDAGDVAIAKYWMTHNVVGLHLQLNSISVTGGVASFTFTLPAAVPRPTTAFALTCLFYDNSATVAGVAFIDVSLTGVVSITKLSGTMTASTNGSFLRAQVSWSAV